jgi:hypothetical protein
MNKTCDDCAGIDNIMEDLIEVPEQVIEAHTACVGDGLEPVFPPGHEYFSLFYYQADGSIYSRQEGRELDEKHKTSILAQLKREMATA